MSASADLIHQTSTGTGTGNLTLVAEDGKRDFSDAWSTGGSEVFWYYISHRSAAEWERGTGSLSASNTLVRDTVVASSNSNNAVNFSAGTKDVTSDIPYANQLQNVVDDTTPQLGGDLDPNGNDWAGVLTPEADNTRDLGSSTRRWNDLYLGGNLYIGGTGAANALDDYEEGTWTPAVVGGGSNPTVTYFAQNGRYTKVGRLVVATWGIVINTFSGGSGELGVTLPFTEAGVTGATGTAYLHGANFDNSAVHLIGGVPIGGSVGVYYEVLDNAAVQTMSVTDLAAGDILGCTVSYEV